MSYLKKNLSILLLLLLVSFSAIAKDSPYLILISIDGFRHDYAKLHEAKTISQFAKSGVSSKALTPIFPSKTFPNHYSIITGQYAQNHGIVANSFYDPKRNETYKIGSATTSDGSWYGGNPLWLAIKKNGIKTASYFWVGSDANIQNQYPTYYFPYAHSTPNNIRVNKVIEWLNLPKAQRPHFITLYFSEVDSAGHKHGPEATQTKQAVQNIDQAIANLEKGIATTGLPVNIVLVSDHGMQKLDKNKIIFLDQLSALKDVRVIGKGTHSNLYITDKKVLKKTYDELKKSPNLNVYLKSDIPRHFHYSKNERIGDIVLSPNSPYYILKKKNPLSTVKGGSHGFDPYKTKTMGGIFYAKGPNFKKGIKLGEIDNIHLYPMIMQLFGLKVTTKIDGRLEVLQHILK
ncbi:MAG: putative AlkP superfamily pyrophosphatase or phosphodiesterase [Thermoproteota archaeon]|jgi:predicted AlkP superfamily pyrophosphatase or phosphodiesterase